MVLWRLVIVFDLMRFIIVLLNILVWLLCAGRNINVNVQHCRRTVNWLMVVLRVSGYVLFFRPAGAVTNQRKGNALGMFFLPRRGSNKAV